MAFDAGPTEPNARGMLKHAWDYFNAAKLLHSKRLGLTMQGPFNYLVSHAFELFTKSFLLSKGLKYEDLKRLSHGIDGLMMKAQELSLFLDDKYFKVAEVIKNLNKYNMQRYPMLGFFTIGSIEYAEPSNFLNYVHSYGEMVSEEIKVQGV